MSMVCDVCGSGLTLLPDSLYQYRECGLEHVFLQGIAMLKCSACNLTVPRQLPQASHINRVIGFLLVTKPFGLLGSEIRFLRTDLEMTQAELAHVLGHKQETISRYETEKKPMQRHSEVALRSFYALTKTIEMKIERHFLEFTELLAGIQKGLRSFDPHRKAQKLDLNPEMARGRWSDLKEAA